MRSFFRSRYMRDVFYWFWDFSLYNFEATLLIPTFVYCGRLPDILVLQVKILAKFSFLIIIYGKEEKLVSQVNRFFFEFFSPITILLPFYPRPVWNCTSLFWWQQFLYSFHHFTAYLIRFRRRICRQFFLY